MAVNIDCFFNISGVFMKKLVYLACFFVCMLNARSQYIPGLIDTLWLGFPNDAEVYCGGAIFHPSGDYFLALSPTEKIDSLKEGRISFIDSETGLLLDSLYIVDSTKNRFGSLKFFPGKDSLLLVHHGVGTDSLLWIYDLGTREVVRKINIRKYEEFQYFDVKASSPLLSVTGDTVILNNSVSYIPGFYEEELQLWHLPTDSLLVSIQYEEDDVTRIRPRQISPNGQYFTYSTEKYYEHGAMGLGYMDSIKNRFSNIDYSLYDGVHIGSSSRYAVISPNGRFVAMGQGLFIYDAVNHEIYGYWEPDSILSPKDREVSLYTYAFLDNRFLLLSATVTDTSNHTTDEWWVFDIEIGSIVHRVLANPFEERYYKFKYDPVQHYMLFHGEQNNANMYKINLDLLYTTGSIQNVEYDDTLFPNPATDIVNIELEDPGIIEKVILTDMTGKEISSTNMNYTINNDKIEIISSNLSSGTYIVTVLTGKESRSFKVIIEK